MAKNYIDYCREAIVRDPKTYKNLFNPDGTRKKEPMFSSAREKKSRDIPAKYLDQFKKKEWTPCLPDNKKIEPPKLEVTGTEIKLNGRKLNLTMKKFPPDCSRKEYNKIWMYNDRIKKKLKMLKEQYGITKSL